MYVQYNRFERADLKKRDCVSDSSKPLCRSLRSVNVSRPRIPEALEFVSTRPAFLKAVVVAT